MALVITAEISTKFEQFQRALHMVDCIKSAFCEAPPNVNAEPYQYLLESAVGELLACFDDLCSIIGLPN